jgi:uncharacterized repeat protein (TIGR01451 family)
VLDDSIPGGGNLRSRGTLSIFGGEITGGKASRGGGMDLDDDVATLDGVTIEDNESEGGGGISNGTDLTITNSRFIGNRAGDGRGGGIDHTALDPLNVTDSHFEGNSAYVGGGLAFEGGPDSAKLLTGISLVGNTAVESGGGLFTQNIGSFKNFTIYGNTVTDPAGRGAGIEMQGSSKTLELHHGTIAGNTAPLGADVNISSGHIEAISMVVAGTCRIDVLGTVSASGSFSTGSSCGFSGPGSRSGATLRLGPLTQAGVDMVLPLLGGSDAIDGGAPLGCLAVDQRGVPRPEPGCDAGAYEALKTDLSLALTATPSGVVTGGDVTLTATVTNRGPRDTGGVFATLPLPAGTSFVSGSPGCAAGPPVVCQLGSLNPDGVAQATVVARTSAPGALSFSASTLADLAEATPGDEAASATVRVADPPPGPDADKRKPSLRIALARGQRAARAARARRLKLRLTSDEACTGSAAVHRGARRLARVRGRSFKAATTTITLRLSKPAARRLRRAGRLSLRATCTDAAGNTATTRRTAGIK